MGDPSSIPGSGRSPGVRNGNPLQYGKSHGQRSLVGYSPWGRRQSDMTEQLTRKMIKATCVIIGTSTEKFRQEPEPLGAQLLLTFGCVSFHPVPREDKCLNSWDRTVLEGGPGVFWVLILSLKPQECYKPCLHMRRLLRGSLCPGGPRMVPLLAVGGPQWGGTQQQAQSLCSRWRPPPPPPLGRHHGGC